MLPVHLAAACRAPSHDEDTLLAGAQTGDEPAFRHIYETHRGHVARLVCRLAGSRSDLEDLVQSVFLQVHRNLESFRGEATLKTWLHRITVNTVLMQLRAERRRPKYAGPPPREEDIVGTDLLPDESAERRERIRALERLLARLTDKKRVVFVLHELEGLSPAEISEMIGAPVLTVRTRLFYARRELESMLRDEPALAALDLRDAPEDSGPRG